MGACDRAGCRTPSLAAPASRGSDRSSGRTYRARELPPRASTFALALCVSILFGIKMQYSQGSHASLDHLSLFIFILIEINFNNTS